MSEKNYLNILKGGIFASFIILLFAFSGLLFPFISSKQLSFNILIEVLIIVWLLFLIQYPRYLPKKSNLTLGLVIYFITILMSLAVSVDFNLSFWGDVERMLGLFHLLHFLFFYFIIITVFRSKKDYHYLLNGLVISALLVAIIGLFKKVPHSTIGNVAYVAAMMLFAMFLQVKFFLQSRDWLYKSLYVIGFIIALIGFIKSDISGSQAGLLAGIFVSILVLAIVSKNKKVKIIILSTLTSFVVLVVLLFAFRSHSIFDGSYIGKSLRDFSTENNTFSTRLISYQAAGRYLIDHPISMIFGVGHGNYAHIFDKYFSAKFYDYDRVATYFDRAHNNVIDILTTTGILGLLAYLSIFVFMVIYLIRAYKIDAGILSDRKIDKIELSLLFGLLTAYFVQNLAVFDSFATYLYIMIIFAYIHYLGLGAPHRQEVRSNETRIRSVLRNIAFPVAVVVVLFSLSTNFNTFKMLQKTIEAYTSSFKNGISIGADNYRKIFEKYNTGLERDARESLINLVLDNSSKFPSLSPAEAEKAITLAVEVAERNEKYNQNDSLALFRLSKLYDLAGKFYFNQGNQDKGSYYANLAFSTLDRSIENSPNRVPLYLNRANMSLNFNKKEDAIKDIEYAKSLNSTMPESYCQASHFYFIEDDFSKFIDNFSTCSKLGGLTLMNWNDFITSVEGYYYNQELFDNLIKFYEVLVESQPENAETISKLALLHFQLGDFDSAQAVALKLLDIEDGKYQSEVAEFMQEIATAKREVE